MNHPHINPEVQSAQMVNILTSKLELPQDDAEQLLASAKHRVLAKGEILFQQGGASQSFFILLRGQLIGQRTRPSGHIDLTLNFYAGEVIGELGFFDHSARTLTVTARRDCVLLEIDEGAFQDFGKRSHSVYNHLIKVLVSRFKRELGYSTESNNHQFVWFHNLIQKPDLEDFFREKLLAQLRSQSEVNVWSGAHGFQPGVHLSAQRINVEWIEAQGLQDFPSESLLDDLDTIVLVVDEQAMKDPEILSLIGRYQVGIDNQIQWKILLLEEGERVNNALLEAVQQLRALRAQVLNVRLQRREDFLRVSRHILGTTVGLVLGGGGARGFAHAGFYRALEESNVVIDWIGGTSMGALVGALIASGMSADEVQRALAVAFRKGLPFSIRDYLLPRHGFIRSASVDQMYQRAFGQSCIESLLIPFFAVSCDLTTGNQHLFEQGLLWQAIRASTSIPVFFEPCLIDNHIMVDGALINNVPVDDMRAKGAKHIIAVDVGMEEDLTVHNQENGKTQMPNLIKSLMRVIELGGIEKSRRAKVMSDVYIQPKIEQIGLMDFERREEVIELGYEAGVRAVSEIGLVCR